jgi:hypothetical protein
MSITASAQASPSVQGRKNDLETILKVKNWQGRLMSPDLNEPIYSPPWTPDWEVEETREILEDEQARSQLIRTLEGDLPRNGILMDLISIAGVIAMAMGFLKWFIAQGDRFLESVHCRLMEREELYKVYQERKPRPPATPPRNATPSTSKPQEYPVARAKSEDPNDFPIPSNPSVKLEKRTTPIPLTPLGHRSNPIDVDGPMAPWNIGSKENPIEIDEEGNVWGGYQIGIPTCALCGKPGHLALKCKGKAKAT